MAINIAFYTRKTSRSLCRRHKEYVKLNWCEGAMVGASYGWCGWSVLVRAQWFWEFWGYSECPVRFEFLIAGSGLLHGRRSSAVADAFRRCERGHTCAEHSSGTDITATVHVNSTFTRYVRQSGLDVDTMSATNNIRTTRMHRMACRAVWRLLMNPRRGLRRRCLRYNNMVKEKANSIRIYDSEGYRRRAACICVKDDLEDEVSRWQLPIYFYRHVVVRISYEQIVLLVGLISDPTNHWSSWTCLLETNE